MHFEGTRLTNLQISDLVSWFQGSHRSAFGVFACFTSKAIEPTERLLTRARSFVRSLVQQHIRAASIGIWGGSDNGRFPHLHLVLATPNEINASVSSLAERMWRQRSATQVQFRPYQSHRGGLLYTLNHPFVEIDRFCHRPRACRRDRCRCDWY